jgi:hypothetical protein
MYSFERPLLGSRRPVESLTADCSVRKIASVLLMAVISLLEAMSRSELNFVINGAPFITLVVKVMQSRNRLYQLFVFSKRSFKGDNYSSKSQQTAFMLWSQQLWPWVWIGRFPVHAVTQWPTSLRCSQQFLLPVCVFMYTRFEVFGCCLSMRPVVCS